jgi:hypothetical protein
LLYPVLPFNGYMQFSVKKNITPKKKQSYKRLIDLLILVIAIPVLIIAGISLSLYFVFTWLRDLLVNKNGAGLPEETYHLRLDLVQNEQVHLVLVEDELDTELTMLNEAWHEQVYNEETCLYRLKTAPLIPALEGSICCFYFKEAYNGILLQLVPNTSDDASGLLTRLVFLNYKDLQVSLVDETGPFFLFNDENDRCLIHGFNKKEKISLELLPADESRGR